MTSISIALLSNIFTWNIYTYIFLIFRLEIEDFFSSKKFNSRILRFLESFNEILKISGIEKIRLLIKYYNANV